MSVYAFFCTFGVKNEKTMKLKSYILSLTLLILPVSMSAQKISLGTCTTKDGGEYNGEMAAGKPHGKGKTIWKNGNLYEGEYVKGKREGHGIYTFSDGERYEGQWMQDHQHGQGTYYFQNNNV